MKEIILDGEKMVNNPHDYIKNLLNFPDYYGCNLDSLYDCLTDISVDTKIVLINPFNVDGDIIKTFTDASKVDTFLYFNIIK